MSSDAMLFQESLVDDGARTARPYTVSFSLTMQLIAAAAAMSYPLWHIEPLPRVKLRAPSPFINAVKLVDPAPAQPASAPRPQMSASNALTAPSAARKVFVAPAGRTIAAGEAIIDSDFLPRDQSGSDGPFIPGAPEFTGTGSGSGIVVTPPPKPRVVETPPAPAAPVRVGGDVRPPLLLVDVKPVYPQLARAARIQGTVKIEAIIARDGTIRDARVVSGHPLLIAAAIDAVRQWRYRATVLNGVSVEVVLALEVNFRLSQ